MAAETQMLHNMRVAAEIMPTDRLSGLKVTYCEYDVTPKHLAFDRYWVA